MVFFIPGVTDRTFLLARSIFSYHVEMFFLLEELKTSQVIKRSKHENWNALSQLKGGMMILMAFKVKIHIFWSSDHEKLFSRSVVLPENFSGSTTDLKQFSKQPEKCVVIWKVMYSYIINDYVRLMR